MEKELSTIEHQINSILFWLSIFVTVVAMAMMLIGFFSRGEFPQTGIGTFYVGVLLIYSLHKEALRWLEEQDLQKRDRKGEYFVYTWIIMTALLYLINFFSKDYYRFDNEGVRLPTLFEITATTLEVGGVFILTRIIKTVFHAFVMQKK